MRARSARREAPFQRLRAICEHGRFLQRDLKGYIDGAKLPVPRAIQPTLRSFAFRLALKEGTYHFALKTPQAAAYAGLAWSRGGPGLPSGMGFSGDAAWLSTTTAGRFGALDRLATARQIKSATPGRGVTAGGKYDVGEYAALRRRIAEPGLEAHHVGQQALMKRYVPGYDPEVAPAILVPKVGHTIRGPQGIVSRSTSGISSARQAVARDIFELRRVYPGVPNSQLKTLIEMNKQMYPAVRVKP